MISLQVMIFASFLNSLFTIPTLSHGNDCVLGVLHDESQNNIKICTGIDTSFFDGVVLFFDSLILFLLSIMTFAQSLLEGILSTLSTPNGVLYFVFLPMVLIGVILFVLRQKNPDYRNVERLHFSDSVKKQVMINQNGKCAKCNQIPRHWEFDHVNGRGDNSIENCQGLCRDCHMDKTLDDGW